jgi:hypothetical protein
MKKELQQKLIEKYPVIFKDCSLSPMESCMGRGLECGDGWYDLIDQLCQMLQWHTDSNGFPQVICAQLKQKFGRLTFYYDLDREGTMRQRGYIEGVVNTFSSMSERVCEKCGGRATTHNSNGWIVANCDKCFEGDNNDND